MSIMVSDGLGARVGVLVKNAEALERLEKVDTLVVDKTGTLTEGRPKVIAVAPMGIGEDELLRLAAAVERQSQHPLSAAIVAEAAARKLKIAEVADFDAPTGRGVTGTVEGKRVAIGKPASLAGLGVDTAMLTETADAHRHEGATAILVAIDGKAAGVIAVADPVKASTMDALAALKAKGIRVIMLTGDNRTTAEAVARKLGLGSGSTSVMGR